MTFDPQITLYSYYWPGPAAEGKHVCVAKALRLCIQREPEAFFPRAKLCITITAISAAEFSFEVSADLRTKAWIIPIFITTLTAQ